MSDRIPNTLLITNDEFQRICQWLGSIHCVKSVRIRSFSGWYFPAFVLNTERWCKISVILFEIHLHLWEEKAMQLNIIVNFGVFIFLGEIQSARQSCVNVSNKFHNYYSIVLTWSPTVLTCYWSCFLGLIPYSSFCYHYCSTMTESWHIPFFNFIFCLSYHGIMIQEGLSTQTTVTMRSVVE